MSLIPSCWDDWFHNDWEWDYDREPFHRHCLFKSGACDLFHRRHHYRWDPWCHRSCLTSKVTVDQKSGFKVVMDVHHFKLEEMVIKVLNDTIILEGKHKRDHDRDTGPLCISHEFIRKYRLPRGYDPATVVSTLSSDGILTISAPSPPKQEPTERLVSIVPTGAYLTSSSSSANDASGEKQNEEKK